MFLADDLAMYALIASMAGAAMNSIGNAQTARRVNALNNDAQANINKGNERIREMAMDRVQAYDSNTRDKQKEEIQKDMEQSYTEQPTDAVTIAQDAATTQGDTSSDYESAKSASDQRIKDNIKTYGNLMSRVNSAKKLRQNENWINADVANMIGAEQARMQAQNRLDQYKINQAANSTNAWNTLGNVSSLAGAAMGLGSMFAPASAATTATDGALEGLSDFTSKGTDAANNFLTNGGKATMDLSTASPYATKAFNWTKNAAGSGSGIMAGLGSLFNYNGRR